MSPVVGTMCQSPLPESNTESDSDDEDDGFLSVAVNLELQLEEVRSCAGMYPG